MEFCPLNLNESKAFEIWQSSFNGTAFERSDLHQVVDWLAERWGVLPVGDDAQSYVNKLRTGRGAAFKVLFDLLESVLRYPEKRALRSPVQGIPLVKQVRHCAATSAGQRAWPRQISTAEVAGGINTMRREHEQHNVCVRWRTGNRIDARRREELTWCIGESFSTSTLVSPCACWSNFF